HFKKVLLNISFIDTMANGVRGLF
ncbi:MAG: hypothetical protein RL682_446, partial [Pseudomonadota bacterium]